MKMSILEKAALACANIHGHTASFKRGLALGEAGRKKAERVHKHTDWWNETLKVRIEYYDTCQYKRDILTAKGYLRAAAKAGLSVKHLRSSTRHETIGGHIMYAPGCVSQGADGWFNEASTG